MAWFQYQRDRDKALAQAVVIPPPSYSADGHFQGGGTIVQTDSKPVASSSVFSSALSAPSRMQEIAAGQTQLKDAEVSLLMTTLGISREEAVKMAFSADGNKIASAAIDASMVRQKIYDKYIAFAKKLFGEYEYNTIRDEDKGEQAMAERDWYQAKISVIDKKVQGNALYYVQNEAAISSQVDAEISQLDAYWKKRKEDYDSTHGWGLASKIGMAVGAAAAVVATGGAALGVIGAGMAGTIGAAGTAATIGGKLASGDILGGAKDIAGSGALDGIGSSLNLPKLPEMHLPSIPLPTGSKELANSVGQIAVSPVGQAAGSSVLDMLGFGPKPSAPVSPSPIVQPAAKVPATPAAPVPVVKAGLDSYIGIAFTGVFLLALLTMKGK